MKAGRVRNRTWGLLLLAVVALSLLSLPVWREGPPPQRKTAPQPQAMPRQEQATPPQVRSLLVMRPQRETAGAQPAERLPPADIALLVPTIAGFPSDEARAIFERQRGWLLRLPDVEGVELWAGGILVFTENPAVVPLDVEGLPIEARAPQRLTTSGGMRYREAEAIFARHREWLLELPGVEEVSLWVEGILVFTDRPELLPEQVEGLPIQPRVPMTLPVAGIPYKEAMAILERNREWLTQLSGVEGVALGGEGIQVFSDNPAAVPAEVEGLPTQVFPPRGFS